jgi:predicted aconitase with swiveling domain
VKFAGRKISSGYASGEVLVSSMGISFYGGIDPETGQVVEKGHDLEGETICGKILVFPTGKGSTVGSYTLYRLKKAGKAPAAIINSETETITAVGCIISDIPCVDHIPIEKIGMGSRVIVNGENGIVEIL